MTGNTGTERAPEGSGSRSLTVWIVAIAVPALVVALAFAALLAGGGEEAPAAAHPDRPLELASVSSDLAAHYRFAADHAELYRDIPCYCGCEKFLGHRDLYDCFVRADGRGWEAHASGCGVCIGESATARRLSDAGEPPGAIRDAVIAQFGATPGTTPPPS